MELSPALPRVELGQIFLEAAKRQGKHSYTSVQRGAGGTGFVPFCPPSKMQISFSQGVEGAKSLQGPRGGPRAGGGCSVLAECCTTCCCCRLSDASAALCGRTQPGIAKDFVLNMEGAGPQLGEACPRPHRLCHASAPGRPWPGGSWRQGHVSIAHWRAGPGANWPNTRTGDTSSLQPDENLHPEQRLSPARAHHGFSKPSIPLSSLPCFLSDGEG